VLISFAHSANASRNTSSYFWNDVLLHNCHLYKRVVGKRVLVQIIFVQGTDPLSITFRPRETLASYAIAYSINIELSQAQLSFSI
jgi:hypothetical protein